MKKMTLMVLSAVLLLGCEKPLDVNVNPDRQLPQVSKSDLASVLSSVPLDLDQVWEVYDAADASDINGYDEEYTFKNVVQAPGYGVGDDKLPAKSYVQTKSYSRPLRDLIFEYYSSSKAGVGPLSGQTSNVQPQDYLEALEKGDLQIYWPYHAQWDGKTLPVVSFDPGFDAEANTGIDLATGQEVIVNDALARKRPVWIVNSNNDAEHISMEIFSQITPPFMMRSKGSAPAPQASSDESVRSLVLKSFCALRSYDNFFAGANEFFIKIGGIDHFRASTEAELKLFNPHITDFMKVVKRGQVGEVLECNSLLMSNWTRQLESCAFLICEDDGGTITQWNAEAIVKVASKSYGVTLSIPVNSKDDIVWRGSLAVDFLEGYIGETLHLGDVDLVFDFLEY